MSVDFYDSMEEDALEPLGAPAIASTPGARIFASGWGTRADRAILAKLDDIRRAGGRYQNRGAFLETNHAGQGFYLERGGIWNDTSGRVGLGCTKADVSDLRSALRAIGVVRSMEDVERALATALHMGSERDTLSSTERFALDAKDYWKAQAAARREKLRASGKCIVCGTNPVDAGRSTCHECGAKANARTKARKARAAGGGLA